jgi:hypothetical protein
MTQLTLPGKRKSWQGTTSICCQHVEHDAGSILAATTTAPPARRDEENSRHERTQWVTAVSAFQSATRGQCHEGGGG